MSVDFWYKKSYWIMDVVKTALKIELFLTKIFISEDVTWCTWVLWIIVMFLAGV